jgi:hypothetical protein
VEQESDATQLRLERLCVAPAQRRRAVGHQALGGGDAAGALRPIAEQIDNVAKRGSGGRDRLRGS